MWKRIELHNHTVESDGIMTVRELAAYLSSQGIRNFSLTDHNTISGWPMLPGACLGLPVPLEYVRGLELTTCWGHLLCQNISSYVPWEDLDKTNGDLLFNRVHEAGGLAGPAHPFSIPAPFSNGMRWTIKIRDYHLVDFIEIINNAHPMTPDNHKAILWWEQLVFQGYAIAPVSGTDLHRPVPLGDLFTTYMEVPNDDWDLPLSDQLNRAIRSLRTCVSKGPIADWRLSGDRLSVFLHQPDIDSVKQNLVSYKEIDNLLPTKPFLCQIRMEKQVLQGFFEDGFVSFDLSETMEGSKAATIFVYEQAGSSLSSLTAIAGPVFFH